jgi:peptidoglycan/xylan/chitin deacetylase (PgdA/CDA1 family)
MQRIPILMYHQIDELTRPDEPMRGLVVSPSRFAAHMRMIRRLGFIGLSMAEISDCWHRGKRIPGRVVGITFDDGYENNLIHASPALRACGFSATCYVVSGLVGQTNAWDGPKGIPTKRLMDWSQLAEWQAQGMDVGSHTHTHANLKTLDSQAVLDEMANSRTLLQKKLGIDAAQHFCYPYGSYDTRALETAMELGYRTATTTVRARATTDDSPFELPRVLVSRTTNSMMLAVKLLTAYEDRRDTRGK